LEEESEGLSLRGWLNSASIRPCSILTQSITELKRKIEENFSVKALAIPVDVCSSEQVERAVKRVNDEFGRIDILVNCHGIGQWASAEEMTEEDWKRMLDVNLTGVFLMCQAVGRFMIKQRYGKIINIASMSGSLSYPWADLQSPKTSLAPSSS